MRGLLLTFLYLALFSTYAANDYRLKAGDSVSIHVYGEDDLTLTTKLDASSKIRYPFIGEIVAEGKTVAELAELIETGLRGDYLINPDVHVSISEYRPFYIHGQVKKPGSYSYQPGLTVSMGIALAGGLTERASSTWLIKRAGSTEQDEVTSNYALAPGDILTIKQSFF